MKFFRNMFGRAGKVELPPSGLPKPRDVDGVRVTSVAYVDGPLELAIDTPSNTTLPPLVVVELSLRVARTLIDLAIKQRPPGVSDAEFSDMFEKTIGLPPDLFQANPSSMKKANLVGSFTIPANPDDAKAALDALDALREKCDDALSQAEFDKVDRESREMFAHVPGNFDAGLLYLNWPGVESGNIGLGFNE